MNLVDSKRAVIKVHGLPMANVELRSFSGNYVLVRLPGEEADLKGKPVERDRVVPLADVAGIDYL